MHQRIRRGPSWRLGPLSAGHSSGFKSALRRFKRSSTAEQYVSSLPTCQKVQAVQRGTRPPRSVRSGYDGQIFRLPADLASRPVENRLELFGVEAVGDDEGAGLLADAAAEGLELVVAQLSGGEDG